MERNGLNNKGWYKTEQSGRAAAVTVARKAWLENRVHGKEMQGRDAACYVEGFE